MEVTTVSFFSAAAGDVWPFIVAHVHDLGSKSLLLCYGHDSRAICHNTLLRGETEVFIVFSCQRHR